MADTLFIPGVTVIESTWLNDVNDLTYGIGNSTDPSKGASLVGYKNSTIQERLEREPSVQDSDQTSYSDKFAEITSEVRNDGGGHFSSARASVTVTTPAEIVGEFSSGVIFDGNKVSIRSTTASPAFMVENRVGSIASQYQNKTVATNFEAIGNGAAGSIAMMQRSAADVTIRDARFKTAEIGLYLHGALTSDYTNITTRENDLGIKAEARVSAGLQSLSPNAISFYSSKVFYNDQAVHWIGGADSFVNWFGCNIEANNESGTAADGVKVTHLENVGHQNFIGAHFESNKGQYGIWYEGADSTKSLVTVGCEIIHETDTVLRVERGRFTDVGSRITNGTATNDIYLNTGARAVLLNTEGTVSGDMTHIVGIRDGRLGFGRNPIDTDPLISGRPAAIASASNIVTEWQNDTVQHAIKNSAGTRIAYTQYSNTADVVHHVDNAYGHRFDANNLTAFYIGRAGALSVEPGADNTISNGSATFRFSVVYAGTGAINTSDANEKQDIVDISDVEKDVALAIKNLIKRYRFKDAVASKGDQARYHFGVLAQEVAEAFDSHGLNPNEYALFCCDKWEENGIEKQRYGIRYDELICFIISVL